METVMETKSFKLNLQVNVCPKASSSSSSSSKFLSSVVISTSREIEEFLEDKNENSVTSLITYSDPNSPTDSPTLLEFQSFEPNYAYEILQNKLHDHVLSQHMCNLIVDKAQQQRRRSQSLDIPLSVEVSVKLIRKEYYVVPRCSSPPLTIDLEKQNDGEEPKTCSICLENVYEVKGPICQMPNCSHMFHENCVLLWLNRSDSCPLCRQCVNEQQE